MNQKEVTYTITRPQDCLQRWNGDCALQAFVCPFSDRLTIEEIAEAIRKEKFIGWTNVDPMKVPKFRDVEVKANRITFKCGICRRGHGEVIFHDL